MVRTVHFRTLRCHDVDWYDVHRIADKLGVSYVDAIHLIVAEKLRALGLEPTDLEQRQGGRED